MTTALLLMAAIMWPEEPAPPPGDWTTRREWMTTFYQLREVRQ